MNLLAKRLIVATVAFSFVNPLIWVPPAQAQFQRGPQFDRRQLDQDLAPVALYPDQLLSQILMASTYPLEVMDADRWLRDRNNSRLRGRDLEEALFEEDWDPSVKSLVPFPQIVQMMASRPDWMDRLGDAFLAQEEDVMDAVQRLRQQAYRAGSLRTTPQHVVDYGPYISIRPARPDTVYVPVYDPRYSYGRWDYPDYPPVYFPPPSPNYYVGPAIVAGIGFAVGVGIVASLWGWNRWDWDRRRVVIERDRYIVINRNRQPIFNDYWVHDSYHRRDVVYRIPEVRERFDRGDFGRYDNRRDRRYEDQFRVFEQRSRELDRDRQRNIERERQFLREAERNRDREVERDRQRMQQADRERDRREQLERRRDDQDRSRFQNVNRGPGDNDRQNFLQQQRDRDRDGDRDRNRDRDRDRQFQQDQDRDRQRNAAREQQERQRDRDNERRLQQQQQQQQQNQERDRQRQAREEQQNQQRERDRERQQDQERQRQAAREQSQQRDRERQFQQQQNQQRDRERQQQQQQQQNQQRERDRERQTQQNQERQQRQVQQQQQQQQQQQPRTQNNQRQNNDENRDRNRNRDRDRDRN